MLARVQNIPRDENATPVLKRTVLQDDKNGGSFAAAKKYDGTIIHITFLSKFTGEELPLVTFLTVKSMPANKKRRVWGKATETESRK